MSFRVEHRDGSTERRIVIAMIVDPAVLGRIQPKWVKGQMKSAWANVIGQWCCDYYRDYQKAPGATIESIYESWAGDHEDKDTVKIIEKFLTGLSGEYTRMRKQSNSDFVIDMASKHFDRIRLERLADTIKGDLETGDIEKARSRADGYKPVELGVGEGIDVLRDVSAIKQAFNTKSEVLIQYPGALGTFFGKALERDALIAFTGPEKSGKTWWLLDMAWRGMQQGRKVAFFEVGDLSQNQIMRRFTVRAAKRPFDKGKVRRPINITHAPDDPMATVDFQEKEFKTDMSYKQALEACQRVASKDKETYLKLSVHPNDSISIHGIESILESWERNDNWSPDIVVLDYPDILAPPTKYDQGRDAINATWKRMRAITQSWHSLMVVATQSDAASYRAQRLDRTNFTEDKRKLAHVNGMIGINVFEGEKEQMLTRLNWIVLREGEFNTDVDCHVAGALGIANPAVLSTF
jgi:hypothetical protein